MLLFFPHYCPQKYFLFFFFVFFFFFAESGFFLGFFFSDLGGDAKNPPKKFFFSQVQAGFPLIFMEFFSKTVKICPKRGQNFSGSAQKSPFISRKYVITWMVTYIKNQTNPFSHVPRNLPSIQEETAVMMSELFDEATVRNISKNCDLKLNIFTAKLW